MSSHSHQAEEDGSEHSQEGEEESQEGWVAELSVEGNEKFHERIETLLQEIHFDEWTFFQGNSNLSTNHSKVPTYIMHADWLFWRFRNFELY